MKRYDYIKNTSLIWFLFLVCIYSILACEFESLRMNMFSINMDVHIVNKINGIIKNLSFSYVAGVIFFFLSDTIPFLRRQKIVSKNVNQSLDLMSNALDEFSQSINGKIWEVTTNPQSIYEDIFGGEYTEQGGMQILPPNIQADMLKLVNVMNPCIDYIISQELYVDSKLVKDIEDIKFFHGIHFMSSLLMDVNNKTYISPKQLVSIFMDIIRSRSIIFKYI